MGVRAGLLNEMITFRESVITRDEYGEQSTEWRDAFTARARVQHQGGSRVMENSEVWHPATVIFTVRCYHDVKDEMEIVYNNHRYNIIYVDRQSKNQQTVITAEVINE